jgi:hypothetical protein
MPNESSPQPPPLRNYELFPGFLSLLVPGLGQIHQGRVGKGLLFLVCIYTLFFYGMYLGQWKNVYLPRAKGLPDSPLKLGGRTILEVPRCLSYRVQYLGQFWVGVAAWPALYQYWFYDENDPVVDPYIGTYQRTPPEEKINELQTAGDKTWDLGWIYTVIAGVLNIMVIYDAIAGPAYLLPSSRVPAKEAA